jgi:hypothetical protein
VSTIPSGPPPIQHTIPAHAPIGKPAVGLESVVDKDAPLPPVEDATETERLHQRDVIVKLSGDAEHGRDQQSRQDAEPEHSAADTPAPPTEAVAAGSASASATVAANPYRARHLADFEPHTLPPGSLLDQTI